MKNPPLKTTLKEKITTEKKIIMAISVMAGLVLVGTFIAALVISLSSLRRTKPSLPQPIAKITGHTQGSITFGELDFTTKIEEGVSYDQIHLQGALANTVVPVTIQEGAPQLPVQTVLFALPPQAKIEKIELLSSERVVMPDIYHIYPAPKDVDTNSVPPPVKPIKKIYSSEELYPGKIIGDYHVGHLRDHRLVSIEIYPVQYRPALGEITLYNSLTIGVSYSQPQIKVQPALLKRSSKIHEWTQGLLKKLVLNPQKVGEFSPQVRFSGQKLQKGFKAASLTADALGENIEYLVITNQELREKFQPLIDWKTQKGVPAGIATTEEIYANYDGRDPQEKIRNFLKDAYANRGVYWVLLGGDTNIIPERYVHYNNEDVATDLYYADLDSTWDEDGDNIFGETGDNPDRYADLMVGRVPARDKTSTELIVTKILTYEKNPPSGFQIKFLYSDELGGMDDRIDPYLPEQIVVTPEPNSLEKMVEALNEGHNFVNVYGHGNFDMIQVRGAYLLSSHLLGLENWPKGGMFASHIACYTNYFPLDIAFSEAFILSPNGGGIAYIGNSHLGQSGARDFTSYFYETFFSDNIYHIGETHHLSKAKKISDRWHTYTLNFLGDPEIPMWTDIPRELTVFHPNPFNIEEGQLTITVQTEDSPLENALVSIVKQDEVYLNGFTGANGQITFELSDLHLGQMSLTVTGQNVLPYEATIILVRGATPPEAPTGLLATPGESFINLSWQANSEADLAGYNLYRSQMSGSGYTKINTSLITETNFDDTTVVSDITYYYVVTAVDTEGDESTYSQEVSSRASSDLVAPSPPVGLTAEAGDTLVNLSWQANFEEDLAGYRVYRSLSSGSGYQLVEDVGDVVTYQDTEVKNGTVYYYVTTAYDIKNNESNYSEEVNVIPMASAIDKIVFSSRRGGNYEIFTINSDGSDPRQRTSNYFDDKYPAWSPDGTKIAFFSYRTDEVGPGIYVMNVDGSEERLLSREEEIYDSKPSWSPDGTKIAFTSKRDGDYEIYIMDADGSNQVNLTNNAGTNDFDPAWSPDGTKIAFTYDYDLYTINVDGTNRRVILTTDEIIESRPAWSPDGTKITFAGYHNLQYDIYIIDANGQNLIQLTTHSSHDSDPTWSPDGTKIAFASKRDGSYYDIYAMDAQLGDGSGVINLTNSPDFHDGYPNWSPLTSEEPVNQPPEVTINSPLDGSLFSQGEMIDFVGSAEDPEDGPLTGNSLVWVSDRDGQLATDQSFSRSDLSLGDHLVTLTATDSEGLTDEDSITLSIEESNNPPTLTVPPSPQQVKVGETLSFLVLAQDEDNDELTVEAQGLPDGASFKPFVPKVQHLTLGTLSSFIQSLEGQIIPSKLEVIQQELTQLITLQGSADVYRYSFSWTPTAGQEGAYTVTFSASDGKDTTREDVEIEVSL